MRFRMVGFRPFSVLAAGALLLSSAAVAGEPAITGYADYGAFRRQLESIAASEFAGLESLGRTRGRREVYLLRIGAGKPDEKPAVLVIGSVHAPHLLGSELAVRLGQRLVEQAKAGKPVRKMLDRTTFYIIPRPAPDACEAFFRRPYFERTGNERPDDDDRDGETDEDGPEDLDGDGWITMIRVADPSGTHMPHPEDSRLLIEAESERDERGRWRVYVEGRDNDGDEQQGEDPAGGVAFDRNFTFRYGYFAPGAGPHQVSEVETRAVADFAFSHPNIALVLTFTPDENLMRPWKPDASSESQRIKTAVLSADAPYFDFLAEQYREIHGGKDPPVPVRGGGSFSQWAYFHYGRWSLACRGWWVPKVETDEENHDRKDSAEKHSDEKGSDKGPGDAERGAEELNALRWFAQEQIDGFVDWKGIEHADFPDREVEVGGFKPFLRLNPPPGQLEPLTEKHWQFLCRLVELLPRVVIQQTKTEPLGGGVWRVTASVVNQGYLPTASQMGRITRQPHRLQIELQLPKGVSLATGHSRVQLPRLEGGGGKEEQTWLVVVPRARPTSLRLRVWSPSVGTDLKRIKLPGQKAAQKKTKVSKP